RRRRHARRARRGPARRARPRAGHVAARRAGGAGCRRRAGVDPAMIPVDGFTLETAADFVDGAPAAIVCHPHPAFGGRMDNPLILALAGGLRAAGLSTVRFNFRGLGASGGAPTGGLEEHRAVAAAVEWTRARSGGTPRP